MRFSMMFVLACAAWLGLAQASLAKPPLEAFGDVPEIRAMDLSPDGKRLAFLQRRDGEDILVIHDLTTATSKALARAGDIRARYLQFVGNDYVVLVVSKDTRTFGYTGRYEFSAAFAFNLATGKSVQLLRDTKNIYPAQSGLGQILGIEPGGKHVLMPAYMGTYSRDPAKDLLRVPLDSGRGGRLDGGSGSSHTIDWLVDGKARPIMREDFNEQKQLHEVRTRQPDGSWKVIYEMKTPLPEIGVVGSSADGKSLYTVDAADSEFLSLYTMSLADGAVAGPVMTRDKAEVASVVSDINRVVHGVRYSGMYPSYDMFDDALDADIAKVMSLLQGSAVYLSGWSEDWSMLLFFAEGGREAERYMTFDRKARRLTTVATSRPQITPADVGEVITIEYKARDGLKIPALLTWPTGVAPEDRKNLPMVVLPHGGPESYDAVGFDWIAQFLANEGYVVLQPNFRGSAGFGESFTEAGYGEWGRKMQDDITDGANAIARMGWADGSRTCIVGWSYGGYAALAGGAFTPDQYKCVASIAGVSQLRDMLGWEKRLRGAKSRAVTYWESIIGDPDKDAAAIDAVSPALHADKFKAPVLLIHGSADTVVPIRQTEVMNDALKRANKPVQFINIPGDDHSLVENESRRKVLTVLGEFLKTHLAK